jgi:DNA-binding MarR family transcriptional regulator
MGEPFGTPPTGLHSALIRHTGFLISRIGIVARKRFTQRLESLGLSVRMWGVLNVLDAEGALTQQALGRCVGVDPSSMVSTIDELEAKGLVERRRHPTDRRAHAMHLTEEGLRVLARGRELAAGAQEELLAPLSAQERDALHAMLLRIALSADDAAAPDENAAGPLSERAAR